MTVRWLVCLGVLVGRIAWAQGSVEGCLIDAARLGHLGTARSLLSAGAPPNSADRRGFTPLMWAAASGQLELTRELLDRGAAVDPQSADGHTALRLAAANGFVEVVRALILRGADIRSLRQSTTTRQLAIQRGHTEVAALLEQAEALGSRLLQAAGEGHDSLVRQLLSAGAPVNTTNERGETALMMAARNGDLGILQALITQGADVSLRDRDGRTALAWAEPSPTTGKYVVAFLSERTRPSAALPVPRAPSSSPQVKASLRTLGVVLARVPPATSALNAARRRANAALLQLEALSAKWPAESPVDYRENLAGDVSALETALKSGKVEDLLATVQAAADDLEAKLEHCVRSGGTLDGSVMVRVRTLLGAQEHKSWQVFYMPRSYRRSNAIGIASRSTHAISPRTPAFSRKWSVAVLSPRYLDSGNCHEEAIICKVLDMGDRKRRLIPM